MEIVERLSPQIRERITQGNRGFMEKHRPPIGRTQYP